MPETPRFYVWPMADERTFTVVMLLLIGLFAGAVLLELHRRRRDRQLRLKAEWQGVRDLCRDRELPEADCSLLKAVIAQYASDHPYKAVTTRRVFDTCMSAYFRALYATAAEADVADRGGQLRHIREQLGLDYVPLGQRIHSTRELQAGHSIWAAPVAGPGHEWRHYTVETVDEAFLRLKPVGNEPAPKYRAGDRLKFRFWREDDARYVFDAPIQRAADEPARWQIAHVESLIRNQARAHYRIRFDEAVNVAVLSAPRKEDTSSLEERPVVTHIRGRITSLSGGGIALVFQQPIPKQVVLRLSFTIPNQDGRWTVHLWPVGTQSLAGGRWLLRGKFTGIDDTTREAITRYVFWKQKQQVGKSQS